MATAGTRKTRKTGMMAMSEEEKRRNSMELLEEEKKATDLIFDLVRSGTLLEELDQVDVTLLPKIKDVFQNTPFLCAAECKKTDIMAFLLGKQVSEVGEVCANTGNTALHLSVLNGNFAGVELLLGKKAELNIANNVGWTPVFLAVAHNQPQLLTSLIQAKADIANAIDQDGNTPLHLACQYNNVDLTSQLVLNQANPDARNFDGLTPLDNAQEHEICKAFLREVLAQNQQLIYAARDGDTTKITEILEDNPLLVRLDKRVDGMSALEWAVMNGHYEAVQELVSSGAYCNIPSLQNFLKVNVDDNETQDMVLEALSWNENLQLALKQANWDVAYTLVDKSACVTSQEPFTGRTPLHIACSHLQEECPFDLVSLLITKKSDLTARDVNGWTPLLCAANEGHYTTCACILKHATMQTPAPPPGQTQEKVTVANSVLQPNFENVSPISTAIMRDDVVLIRIFADHVEMNKDSFARMELAPWTDLAGEGGKPAVAFLLFHTMSFQFKCEVKQITPYVMKCATNALQRSHRKREHFRTAKAILEATAPADEYEKVNWERVFSQAPDKFKELLEFELEVAVRDSRPKAKAKGKATGNSSTTSPAKAAPAVTKQETEKKTNRKGSLTGDKKGDKKRKTGEEEDIMAGFFGSMQKLRCHTLPTICKIDAEYYKLGKKEQTQLLMSPKICTSVAIELLLERRADPNMFDVVGQTPLFFHAGKDLGLDKFDSQNSRSAFFSDSNSQPGSPTAGGGSSPRSPKSPKMLRGTVFGELQLRHAAANEKRGQYQTELRKKDYATALDNAREARMIVKQLLISGADCNLKDNAGRRAIDFAKDPVIKQMLRVAQVEKTKLYALESMNLQILELRVEGLPMNKEPKFLIARLEDLFRKIGLSVINRDDDDDPDVTDIRIPVGSVDQKPLGYAIVRLQNQTPKNRFNEIQDVLDHCMLYNEKTLTYRTRDKFLEDITLTEDLSLSHLSKNGNAQQNEVAPGWKLVLLNGRQISHLPLSEIMAELGRMKEKQKVFIEVRNPKPLGRMRIFVETHFE
ncbi:unnamed protein product [Amoebophrya sp. A120]|nr:unnamed protein product [Amoebophrya sp. A120]|eukprot:GSA120T00020576001.1